MDVIQTSRAPAAIGPYSQAVRYTNLVFCSGQIGLEPSTGQLAESNLAAQVHQAMQNLRAVLEAGNSSLSCLLKVTLYLRSMNDFAQVNQIYQSYLTEPYPARATVEVSGLPKGASFEIDAIAFVRA